MLSSIAGATEPWEISVSRYNDFQNFIETMIEPRATCSGIKGFEGEISKCDFKSYCEVFKKNKDKPYLYVSESGKIPNFTLNYNESQVCLLYTSPSPRDKRQSRMPSSA